VSVNVHVEGLYLYTMISFMDVCTLMRQNRDYKLLLDIKDLYNNSLFEVFVFVLVVIFRTITGY